MRILVILIGKFIMKALRLSGRNGSALPGLVVEKTYPKLLTTQLDQLEHGVIVVTGTNGKTTTTKSLVYLLEQCGLKVFTNPTGSNFTRGVYAALIKYSGISGLLDYDVAVLELDEAYSRVFAKMYNPRLVLALNVMRDQLDRYGEIDKTAEMIGDTISFATEGAVLNSDDRRVRKLAGLNKGDITYFGVAPELLVHLPSEDDFEGISVHSKPHPRRKKHKNKKGDSRVSVVLEDYRNGSAGFRIGDKVYYTPLKVAGIHNAANLTAALAAAMRVCPDMEPQFIVPSMKNIPAAFGRGEVIRIGDQTIVLALVKNPSGFRQSIQSYDSNDFDAMAFVINDDFADGRDVSWLWDVEFKGVSKTNHKYAGGMRANDMALRLKYDELDSEVIQNNTDLIDKIVDSAAEHTLIYCTYTAMIKLRSVIASKTEVEKIW